MNQKGYHLLGVEIALDDNDRASILHGVHWVWTASLLMKFVRRYPLV